MACRLCIDEIPRGLPGEKADKIKEAGVGPGVRDTRGIGLCRFDGKMQSLRCGLPLSCQE